MDQASNFPLAWPPPSLLEPSASAPTAGCIRRLLDLGAITADYVGHLADDPGSRIRLVTTAALAQLGRSFGAARVTLHRVDGVTHEFALDAEWHAATATPLPASLARTSRADFPLKEGELLKSVAVRELSVVASSLFDCAAAVAVPVAFDGTLRAVLVLQWPTTEITWDPLLAGPVIGLAALLEATDTRLRLGERAGIDDVSGLANRKLSVVLLGRMLARLGRSSSGRSGVAVLQCELVGQSGTNDAVAELPAEIGEEVLLEVGRHLDRSTRETDVAATLGRGRFVVFCDDVTSVHQAEHIAGRLREHLQAVMHDVRTRHSLSDALPLPDLRVGIAFTSARVATGVLLRRADSAAYRAVADPQLAICVE